jgi:hypothetical protein
MQDVIKDFMAVMYWDDERVLTDIIYSFKEAREFKDNLQEMMLAQIHFKAILEVTIITETELEKV